MKMLLGVLLLIASSARAAYFIGPWGPNQTNVQASLGAVLDEKGAVQSGAFTNVAVVYHEADPADTIIPAALQPYIPPESWTLLSFGYGAGLAGLGANVNLATTAQGYASRALLASSKDNLQALGAALKPSGTGLAINAGPEWFATVVRNSTLLPLDQWKGRPGWFVGGSYTKKF